jgi:hypothetical protein
MLCKYCCANKDVDCILSRKKFSPKDFKKVQYHYTGDLLHINAEKMVVVQVQEVVTGDNVPRFDHGTSYLLL